MSHSPGSSLKSFGSSNNSSTGKKHRSGNHHGPTNNHQGPSSSLNSYGSSHNSSTGRHHHGLHREDSSSFKRARKMILPARDSRKGSGGFDGYNTGMVGPLILAENRTRSKVGLLGCIAVIMGCMLGTGVFAAPQEILGLAQTPGTTLAVWVIYGLVTLVQALCFIELACTIPVAGGEYAYLNACFGPFAAFLFQLAKNLIIIPTEVLSKVIGINLINPYYSTSCASKDNELSLATAFIAIIFLILTIYVNFKNSEIATKIQGWLMIINLSCIILVIVLGVNHMYTFGIENKEGFWPLQWPKPEKATEEYLRAQHPVKFAVNSMTMAFYQASFSYSGFTYVCYMLDDVDNPLRTLPIALCLSIPLVIILNTGVNFCYLGSIEISRLVKTETVAADMMRSLYQDPDSFPLSLVWIAPTLVAIACLGSLLSNILASSRISCIGARNSHFPRIFELVQKDSLAPVPSLMLVGVLGTVFAMIPDIGVIIGIGTYLESTVNTCTIFGLIYLRYKEPDLPRPFKLPLLVPISYALFATFLFLTPLVLTDASSFRKNLPVLAGTLGIIVGGIPLYLMFVWRRCGFFRCLENYMIRCWQKIGLLVPDTSAIGVD